MKIINSLFSRLIIIFIITTLMLVIVTANTFRIAGEERPDRLAMKGVLQGISDQFSVPPQATAIKHIEAITGSFSVIGLNGEQWLNNDNHSDFNHCSDIKEGYYQMIGKLLVFRNKNLCFIFTELSKPLSSKAFNHLTMGFISVFIILSLSFFLVYRLFSPLKDLNHAVRKISNGDVTHRVNLSGQNEIGELAENLDHMAAELEKMLQAKQELLLAVSHELRSPLTTARVLADMVTNDKLKGRLCKSLSQLERLVTSLLEAERLNQQHKALDLKEVNLTELTESIIGEVDEHSVSFEVTGSAITVKLDEFRVGLALKNLINNALKYSSNQKVEVSLHFMTERFEVHVLDQGEGISEDVLAHLGEAFYRPDSSRSRDTGGFGLGIYLTQRVAKAHNGTLHYQPNPKHQGTKAVLQIPYLK